MKTIKIGNKTYNVKEAYTDEEKSKGLSGIEGLPQDEGMLFYFDPPEEVSFWMKNTLIPLDIIFIDDEDKVVKVYSGEPNNKDLVTVDNIAYVLEVNQGSGIKEGDELDIDEDNQPVMKVLNQDGSTQMDLWGGERIVSRRETRIIIKKAKKANLSKDDKDYKALGRYIFKVIKGQDNRPAEYVESKE